MKTFIIAEAGVNHNGSMETAKKLIDAAKKAGASAVKFQTFISENLVSKIAKKAEYQEKQTGSSESQLDMIKKLELSFNDFKELKAYCDKTDIMFLSTPFDIESIDFLAGLNIPIWKIPSGEITNLPYLEHIASYKKPVILSTGMSTMEEIQAAIEVLNNGGTKDITLLHCTTEYPAILSDINLKAMETMRRKFNLPVGYSDHTEGIEVAVAACALGAAIIEKHFTLDKNMEGPDHKASLEPNELAALVSAVENVNTALGDGDKHPFKMEIKNAAVARKSIVAKADISKGEILTENNITVKRPGTGISPMEWHRIIGTRAIRDFAEDELIEI